jgi:hypothetical protein
MLKIKSIERGIKELNLTGFISIVFFATYSFGLE